MGTRTDNAADYDAALAVALAYEGAYLKANRKPITVNLTSHSGWFYVDGQRVARKTLIEWTERLNNRAAGIAQLTNAELAERL